MNILKNLKKSISPFVGLMFLLVCFLPVWGQTLEFKYIVIDKDTVSKSVSCKKLPNTENEFKKFMDTLGNNLKFRGWDGLKFWLYIDIVNDIIGWGNSYLKASSEILRATNEWLDEYYLKQRKKPN